MIYCCELILLIVVSVPDGQLLLMLTCYHQVSVAPAALQHLLASKPVRSLSFLARNSDLHARQQLFAGEQKIARTNIVTLYKYSDSALILLA